MLLAVDASQLGVFDSRLAQLTITPYLDRLVTSPDGRFFLLKGTPTEKLARIQLAHTGFGRLRPGLEVRAFVLNEDFTIAEELD